MLTLKINLLIILIELSVPYSLKRFLEDSITVGPLVFDDTDKITYED